MDHTSCTLYYSDVNGLTNAYKLWDRLAMRGDADAASIIDNIERAIRKFVATGTIDPVHLVVHEHAVQSVIAMASDEHASTQALH